MLPLDSAIAATARARELNNDRIRHYHDPDRRAGRVVAAQLGGLGKIAWDTYLGYAAGPEWQDLPPPPTTWTHQLRGSRWADPGRYRTGEGLRTELAHLIGGLLAA